MAQSNVLLSLLERKRQLFERYEAVSMELLTSEEEKLEQLMHERQQIVEQISELDDHIHECCEEDSPRLQEILQNRCERQELDGDLGEIYDQAAQIRAEISRIRELDIQISGRLVGEKERILKQIRESNRGVRAKAAKFYRPSASHASFEFGKA